MDFQSKTENLQGGDTLKTPNLANHAKPIRGKGLPHANPFNPSQTRKSHQTYGPPPTTTPPNPLNHAKPSQSFPTKIHIVPTLLTSHIQIGSSVYATLPSWGFYLLRWRSMYLNRMYDGPPSVWRETIDPLFGNSLFPELSSWGWTSLQNGDHVWSAFWFGRKMFIGKQVKISNLEFFLFFSEFFLSVK